MISMTPTPLDTWTLARLVYDDSPLDDVAVSEELRPLIAMLQTVPLEYRNPALVAYLAELPESKSIIAAVNQADPSALAPIIAAPTVAVYATLEDIAQIVSSQLWLWTSDGIAAIGES